MSKYSRSNIATLCLFVCLAVAVASEASTVKEQLQSKFVKEGGQVQKLNLFTNF